MWQLFHCGIISITIDLVAWVMRLLGLLQVVNHRENIFHFSSIFKVSNFDTMDCISLRKTSCSRS